MELEVIKELNKRGIYGIITNRPICVLHTIPDIIIPHYLSKDGYNVAVYLDGPPHEKRRQAEKDIFLRDLLAKKPKWRVLSIPYEEVNEETVAKIVKEILSEIKTGEDGA